MSNDVQLLFAAHLAEIRRLDAKLAAVAQIIEDLRLGRIERCDFDSYADAAMHQIELVMSEPRR